MVSFKRDLLRGTKTGRLLRYQPLTNTVDILASNIGFANGVAVDADETYVVISETTTARLLKYHLTGRQSGALEPIVGGSISSSSSMDDNDKDNNRMLLPGYPDGAACSSTTGMCYVPIPSIEVPIMRLIGMLPYTWWSALVRTVLLMMPQEILTAIVPVAYGGVVEIYPGDEEEEESGGGGGSGGRLRRILQDSSGEEIAMITGVAVHDDKLYLGSLKNTFIGVYDL